MRSGHIPKLQWQSYWIHIRARASTLPNKCPLSGGDNSVRADAGCGYMSDLERAVNSASLDMVEPMACFAESKFSLSV